MELQQGSGFEALDQGLVGDQSEDIAARQLLALKEGRQN